LIERFIYQSQVSNVLLGFYNKDHVIELKNPIRNLKFIKLRH
jgi:hypothetical protein